MNRKNRLPVLLLSALLAVCMLTACGGNHEEADTTEAADSITETETETEAVTETETEAVTETETEPVTEPVTEAVTEPVIPAVVEDDGQTKPVLAEVPEGTFVNPLTGRVCEQEQAERRPAAIMLNNIAAALPQQHIDAADILYECEVEGGLTRLLGVYNDYADLKAIGSVRSSREYFIDFAANHGAIYVHAGGSDEAYRNLKNRTVANIDGVNGGAVTGFFYRDPVRRQTMSLEHTLVIDGDKLDAAIAAMKYRTTYASTFENPMHFAGPEQVISLTGGKKAESFTAEFGAHKTSFVYDAPSNTYLRFQNGQKHVEGTTDKQLAFENVLVLFCPYTYTHDEKHHISVTDTGSGDGYLMTGGRYVPIKWSKSYPDAVFRLTYASGRDVVLTPGKTNIEIVSSSSRLSIDG